MAKLDSKKIDSTLKSLTGVLTTAVKTLNEMTDGEFKGSTMETDPLSCARQIIQTFVTAQARVADQAKYDGKSVDEITEMQEAARQAELAEIQEQYNQKLAKRNEKPEPIADPESTGEGNSQPQD